MNVLDTGERRVITLLCGTEARRHAASDEISALLASVDIGRLVALLRRSNLLVLIGGRLLALGLRDAGELEQAVQQVLGRSRKWGAGTELVSLQILNTLEIGGIRALPIKGSILASQLYGDVAARTSVDVDILVSPNDLAAAVARVTDLGWRWEANVRRRGGLPILHETLVHPSFPRVELHWRLHWYERRFAADALARAESPGGGDPLQMQPLDGLAALMLFYARDGFSGLRFPADAAAWWDLRCGGSEEPPATDVLTERYPELTAPLRVASRLLEDLVGVPMQRGYKLRPRWCIAEELATPFLEEDGRQQAEANAGLIDLLLSPPGAAKEAVRRMASNAPDIPAAAVSHGPTSLSAVLTHLARVTGRWFLAGLPALVRGYARGRRSRRHV